MKKILISTTVLLLAFQQAHAAAPNGVDSGYAILLSLMPILLFVLLFIIIMIKTNFRQLLQEVLSDKESNPVSIVRQPVLNDRGSHISVNNEPQFADVNVYPKSTSRLVLFCSSLAAIFIAICIVSASIYGYLLSGTLPDFSKLIGVVLTLGIGVVPYMTHKISKGGSNTRTDNYRTTGA